MFLGRAKRKSSATAAKERLMRAVEHDRAQVAAGNQAGSETERVLIINHHDVMSELGLVR